MHTHTLTITIKKKTTPLLELAHLPQAKSSVQFVGRYEDTRQPEQCKVMQPSISLTLEPGLERGVPWGRDLYTFVTSAAGHMMRTLQKPRKNRPSKRQVNHRRFLHNMIQRKFADIEAANHRLASALFSTEEENKLPSQSSVTSDPSANPSQDVFLLDPDTGNAEIDRDGISKPGNDLSLGSNETEATKKKQPDLGHLWKFQPKSQSKTCTTRKSKQRHSQTHQKRSGSRKLLEFISLSSPKNPDCYHEADHYGNENSLKATNRLSEDLLCCWDEEVKGTNEEQIKYDSDLNIVQLSQHLDTSSFSPQLSPLSLDSCDLSIQMVTDVSTCTQAKNIADFAESQWTDIMDLFNGNEEDFGGCMDMEANFQSICACQGDAEGKRGEVYADDITFVDESEGLMEKMIICSNGNFKSEVDGFHDERGEYGYEHGYGCQGDQGLTVNYNLNNQRESEEEIQFTSFKTSQTTDIIPNHLSPSVSYHYDILDLNMYQCLQQENASMLLNCDSVQNCTPFEGVAQSFPIPTQDPEHRPVPTPPHEDDWLFTDILEDRRSHEC